MTGPPTGAFHTPVYTERPRHNTSFGIPTFTALSVPTQITMPADRSTQRRPLYAVAAAIGLAGAVLVRRIRAVL